MCPHFGGAGHTAAMSPLCLWWLCAHSPYERSSGESFFFQRNAFFGGTECKCLEQLEAGPLPLQSLSYLWSQMKNYDALLLIFRLSFAQLNSWFWALWSSGFGEIGQKRGVRWDTAEEPNCCEHWTKGTSDFPQTNSVLRSKQRWQMSILQAVFVKTSFPSHEKKRG